MIDQDNTKAANNLPRVNRSREFVQLYRSQMRALRRLAIDAPAAHSVLYVLLEKMDQRNALVVSYKTLAAISGLSTATIGRGLRALKEGNYIEVLKSGTTSVIVVNKRVAWTDTPQARQQLAVFDARVVVGSREQDDFGRQLQSPELHRLPPVLVPPEQASLLDDDPSNPEPPLPLE